MGTNEVPTNHSTCGVSRRQFARRLAFGIVGLSLAEVARDRFGWPSANPSPVEAKSTGAKPVEIAIPQLLLSASVETIGIVNGVMDPPKGPWTVSWYKESGRLGVPGNVLMVGALDWSDVGPAVFYHLNLIGKKFHINVTGDDGGIYRFRVAWTKTYDRQTAPIEEIAGETAKQDLTLFTSAGAFDYNTGNYTQILVVRATRGDSPPTRPTSAATPVAADGTCSVAAAMAAMPHAVATPAAEPAFDPSTASEATPKPWRASMKRSTKYWSVSTFEPRPRCQTARSGRSSVPPVHLPPTTWTKPSPSSTRTAIGWCGDHSGATARARSR